MRSEGFRAVRTDIRGDLFATLDTTGSEDDGMSRVGKRSRSRGADTGRRPCDNGGPSIGMRSETRHQLATTVVGSDSSPRTFTECTRVIPDSSIS